MKRVLLIRYHDVTHVNTRLPASLNKAQGIYPPLGIAYIAAKLEESGYEANIIDSQAENLTSQETKKRIEKVEPDVVGVTAMTPTIQGALEILRLTKEINREIVTVMGGPHLSAYPRETVSNRFVDYAVIGEGEYATVELMEALEGKRQLTEVKGLVFKKNNQVHINTLREPNKDLDSLPFPARHLLPTEKYTCVIMEHPMTTMITARGCPFSCSFCFKDKYLQAYRMRSVKSVVDEMEECMSTHKVKEIGFYDDCFPNKKHLIALCNEIISRGLDVHWETPQRADLVDRKLLYLMKSAGCIRIRYGVESGNQRILDLMNKGTTKDQIEKAFGWTREAGLETFAYFMIGYLSETESTVRDTIEFAKKLNSDWAMFTVATPLPTTKLMEQVSGENIVDRNYWENFTLELTNERMPFLFPGANKFCGKAYKEFYLRPSFVFKKIGELRSYNQFKKYVRGAMALLRFKMVS